MSSVPPNPFSEFNEPKPNPYQSPDFAEKPPSFGGNELSAAILTQQRVVAILMIVQGTLSTLMGIFLVVMAGVIPMMLEMDRRNNGFNGGGPPPELRWIMTAAYGGMGLCALIPGGLQIYAGIQGIKLRKHTLGIVALGAGALTLMTCYCFPTSLALLIYGLIIYLHDTSRRAFQLAQEGHSYDAIMQMTMQRRY